MLNHKFLVLPILLIFPLIPLSFSHGVGGETLPPVDLGDRMATISINVQPPIYDPDGSEMFRTTGLAKAGGSFENFEFDKQDLGNIILLIGNIDQTNEFAEITTTVTPEFGIFPILILSIAIVGIIFASQNSKLLLPKYF